MSAPVPAPTQPPPKTTHPGNQEDAAEANRRSLPHGGPSYHQFGLHVSPYQYKLATLKHHDGPRARLRSNFLHQLGAISERLTLGA